MEKSDSDIPRVDLYIKIPVFDNKNKKQKKNIKKSKFQKNSLSRDPPGVNRPR